MRDGIIIQARTGSTRLHNKILLPFYGEQRIIDILIGNIKQACAGKTIVLATTDRPQDDILKRLPAKRVSVATGETRTTYSTVSYKRLRSSISTALSAFVRTILFCVRTLSRLSSGNMMPGRRTTSPTALLTVARPSSRI